MYSYDGDTVLDPYMGTGTKMIASNRCSNNFVGFESDKNCPNLLDKGIEYDVEPLIERESIFRLIEA